MLEIFAIPYIVVTGVIGWMIFEPFFRLDESQSLSRSRVTIGDLLACPLPIGVLLVFFRWVTPEDYLTLMVRVLAMLVAMLFAGAAWLAGLYLMPKTFDVPFLKRVVVVGIIAPFGILLTLGWIGFLVWVAFYSVIYVAPALVAIALSTLVLRMLTLWVCKVTSQGA